MPSTVSGVCLAAATALYWQSPGVGLRAAECTALTAAGWWTALAPAPTPVRLWAAHVEPEEAALVPGPAPAPVIRRPLIGLPVHRQLVHELSGAAGWLFELAFCVLCLVLLCVGCVCGFLFRRCLDLPVLPVKRRDGGSSTGANSRRPDRRALRE